MDECQVRRQGWKDSCAWVSEDGLLPWNAVLDSKSDTVVPVIFEEFSNGGMVRLALLNGEPLGLGNGESGWGFPLCGVPHGCGRWGRVGGEGTGTPMSAISHGAN